MKIRMGKNGNTWKIYAITDDVPAKKVTLDSYPFNRKKQAKAAMEVFKATNKDELDIGTKGITIKKALKDFIETIESNKKRQPETNELYVGYVNNHIAPHIKAEYLTEYKASDFIKTTLPAIYTSQKTGNLRPGESTIISDKVAGEVIRLTKRFFKHCKFSKWQFDKDLLDPDLIDNDQYVDPTLEDYINPDEEWMPPKEDINKLIVKTDNIRDKALLAVNFECGLRLNELLAVCYENIDAENGTLFVQHSLGKDSKFREGFVKTKTSKRYLELSDDTLRLLQAWMDIQINPKVEKGNKQWRRLFNITKNSARKLIKKLAKNAEIEWRGGWKVGRKFSSSFARDNKILTDEQFKRRYGWSNLKTFSRFYSRDLNENQKERKLLINNIIKTE